MRPKEPARLTYSKLVTTMEIPLPPNWAKELTSELTQEYFKHLMGFVELAYQNETVFPKQTDLFSAFSLCDFKNVKVVILGQDPYHGINQAHGLSFSVPMGVTIPPSLRNIYKELHSDLGTTTPTTGDLTAWAKQGVLLLNATLTVKESSPASHQGQGWEIFTDAVIKKVSEEKEHVVFILWGKFAQAKATLIDSDKHLVLTAPHPSPFSAYTGFFGSKPFSKTNEYLVNTKQSPIVW